MVQNRDKRNGKCLQDHPGLLPAGAGLCLCSFSSNLCIKFFTEELSRSFWCGTRSSHRVKQGSCSKWGVLCLWDSNQHWQSSPRVPSQGYFLLKETGVLFLFSSSFEMQVKTVPFEPRCLSHPFTISISFPTACC